MLDGVLGDHKVGSSSSDTARTARIVMAMLALGFFVLGGAATGAYLAVRHIVQSAVIDYTRVLGVRLEPTEVRFGLSFVQITDAKFVALEIPGVSGTVGRITIDFSGLTPKSVLLSGVTVNANGDLLEMADAASGFYERLSSLKQSKSAPPLPDISWRHLAVNLSTTSRLVPTASVNELTLVTHAGPTHDEYSLSTAGTKIGELNLGPAAVAARSQDGVFELGWGKSLQESRWRATYRKLLTADELRFSFQPVPLKEIFGLFDATTAPSELSNTTLQGHIEALRDHTSGRTAGSLTLDLSGFTPPYPAELKAYRFDDRSNVRANFDVDPLFQQIQLRGIDLRTGELSLLGHGCVDLKPPSARLRAELSTALDCVTLAKGWVSERVSGDLGQWTLRNTPRAIQGSVRVKVQIDAESDQLGQAKIVRQIGMGCGLRPMSLVELMNLGLPPMPDAGTVERMTKQFPPSTLLSNLPKWPPLPMFAPQGAPNQPSINRSRTVPNRDRISPSAR